MGPGGQTEVVGAVKGVGPGFLLSVGGGSHPPRVRSTPPPPPPLRVGGPGGPKNGGQKKKPAWAMRPLASVARPRGGRGRATTRTPSHD